MLVTAELVMLFPDSPIEHQKPHSRVANLSHAIEMPVCRLGLVVHSTHQELLLEYQLDVHTDIGSLPTARLPITKSKNTFGAATLLISRNVLTVSRK